jgi:hypothetical protein
MARYAPSDASDMQDYLINWNAGPLGVVLRPDLGADMPPVVAQLLPQPSVLKLAGVKEGDLLISVNGKKTTRLGYEKVVRLLFKERLPMVLHFRAPLQELARGVNAPIAEEQAPRVRSSSRARAGSAQPRASRARGRSDVEANIEQRRNPNAQNLSVESDKSAKSDRKSKRKHRSKHKSKDVDAEERRLRKQFSVVWERGSLGISFRAYNSKVNVPCVDFISAGRGQGRGMDRICVNDVLIAINGEKTKALGVEKVLRWLHVIEKPVVLRFHASSNRIVNPTGGLLPHVAEDEDRPRRPTVPLPQPEYEPAPRPPRRNNSVDQSTPQRAERGFSDDREYELQPAVARRYSRDSGTYFEKQPIDDYEPQYQFATSKIEVKERRYSNNSMNAYARGQEPPFEDGVAGDFRREPMESDPPQFDLRIDAHIVPHRRPQNPPYEDASRFSLQQQQPALLPPTRSRTSSASRDDPRQHEGKPPHPPVTIHAAAARPRLASRDSQASSTSNMSFEEAAGVVARATGKTMEECEFGGVPLLNIKEGTVQAKLMYIYAKACLAKEGSSDDEPAPKDPKPPRTPGNPLGRKTHSKYLSYTILQDDAVASNHIPGLEKGDAGHVGKGEHEDERKADPIKDTNKDAVYSTSGTFDYKLDESFAKMQKDISVPPPVPVVTPPLSSVGPSSVSSENAPNAPSPPATPAEDFISLKDFVVKGDGSLTERQTTSSLHSTATPVHSADGVETETAEDQREKEPAETAEDTAAERTSEAAAEETKPVEETAASEEEHVQPEPVVDTEKQVDEPAKSVELEDAPVEEPAKHTEPEGDLDEGLEASVQLGDDHVDALEREGAQEHLAEHEHDRAVDAEHEGDDADSIASSNERDLAASVASLDDLLELPIKDGHHDDEEFVDDDDEEEEESATTRADDKEAMNTSLGMKLDQVQEEEAAESDGHEGHGQRADLDQQEDHGEEDEEHDDGALSNPIVDELFRNIRDVREVIKDKPALVVLVKKSMIDEIQEILQSLQMELQFERHSTMAVGSTATPPRDAELGRDTEGQHCFRCGASGELAELDVGSGKRELFCQECWEMFFFSEDRRSPVARTSKTLAPSEAGRLTADEDALDEALKYSFHDSSVTREDMIHPWRYLQGSDSMSSSIRDSNASSITDRADEVWL